LVFLFWIAPRGKNMKPILLTTTSLVLPAGVAQAEITWSGTATAGLARDGKVKAGVQNTGASFKAALALAEADDTDAADTGTETYNESLATQVNSLTSAGLTVGTATATQMRDAITTYLATLPAGTTATTTANATAAKLRAMIDANNGSAASATGKMKQYSEVNATASASVETDMGWTVTAAISVDAGTGYDFADDDTFDAAKTNGVALDSVSIDFGAGGKLTLNENDIAHLVDADDDASADLMYTNTFGTASFAFVADIDEGDSDVKASGAVFGFASGVADTDLDGVASYTAAVAADVQWSTKVSMPIAGANVYFAADEAGGDAYGVSGTYMGIGWSVDSKREALAKDTGAKRSNTVGLSYATGALTLGATYDSIKDGDQWGVSAAYAAGALTMNVSTDEGDDWSASGAYALGSGASLVAGTNYTEDAYVGVSFAF
jgi:hypothetical protein